MSNSPITVSEARARVLAATPRLGEETIAVEAALDRVLARDVLATGDTPPFPSSAMDGYAIAAGPAGRRLTVTDESRAGAPAPRELRDGAAIRISTGGAIPAGAEAVIRQEDVERVDADPADPAERTAAHGAAPVLERITTKVDSAPGENIRGAGEDMRAGARIVAAGTRLGPAELGAAVAAGAGVVAVARRPLVAVLCTGDELRAPGAPLRPGEIHNSNAPMLAGLATRFGAIADPAERLPDDLAATEAGLRAALARADVVVISGGVSVGPHDHVKQALAALSVEQVFWRVSLQPGGPTWFGTREGKLVFGLPGNPVSAFVTFSLFAAPALAAMQGTVIEELPTTEAVLGEPVRRGSREQAVRVRLDRRDGSLVALVNGPQGSHMVTSLLGADALALIPAGDGQLDAGTVVKLERMPS